MNVTKLVFNLRVCLILNVITLSKKIDYILNLDYWQKNINYTVTCVRN